LVSLPRNPTVLQIFLEFRDYKLTKEKLKDRYLFLANSQLMCLKNYSIAISILDEVLEGLKLYFDKALGNILLYRFERQQYADIRKRQPNVSMCEVYGAEHLVRLFVQLPMLIAHTTMDQDTVLVLKDHLNQLVLFVQKHYDRYIHKEYDNAPPEYVASTQT
jgi:mortality factor 4-like protein 1